MALVTSVDAGRLPLKDVMPRRGFEALEPLRRPSAELHAAGGFDPVANRDDHIEIVMVHLARDLPDAFCLNYPEFPEGCVFLALSLGIDVHNVLVNGPDILTEQFGDLCLAQPNRLVDQPHINTRLAILAAIKQDFRGRSRHA